MNKANAYITTSWDDGHPLDMRIGDMLDRHGLTGTFYAPRDAGTGVMSTGDLCFLAQKFEIGGHTLHHLSLRDIDDDSARREITDCRQWVEDVTGKACVMFCPPRGRFDSRHIPMIADAGFIALRTVQLLSVDLPADHAALPIMPTTLQVFPHDANAYFRNALKRRSVGGLWRCLLSVRGRNWLDLVDPLLDQVIDSGGVFHLWGHAWEIDRLHQWDALDQAMAKLANRLKAAQCMTNGELCAAVCHEQSIHPRA